MTLIAAYYQQCWEAALSRLSRTQPGSPEAELARAEVDKYLNLYLAQLTREEKENERPYISAA